MSFVLAGLSSLGGCRRETAAALCAALIALSPAAPAAAAPQTKKQQACIGAANKGAALIAGVRSKETSGCIANAAKSGGAIDIADCSNGDPKGKVGAAASKVTSTLQGPKSKCALAPDFGVAPVATLTAAAQSATSAVFTDIFGNSVAAPSSPADAKCLASSLKPLSKLLGAKLGAFRRCKQAGLKARSITAASGLRACMATLHEDPKGKVEKAEAKLADLVAKGCASVSLAPLFPGACAAETGSTSALAACLTRRLDCRACGLLSAADALGFDCDLFDDGLANSSCTAAVGCGDGAKSMSELCDASDPTPANQMCPNSGNGLEACSTYDCGCSCPSFFDFTPDQSDSASKMDRGWTGLTHGERWISSATVTVAVTACTNPSKPCGVCSFEGPVPNRAAGAGDIANRRCSSDMKLQCSSNADCSGFGATCDFYFGAPLPLDDEGPLLCVLQRIAGPISGTVDVSTGVSSVAMDVKWIVYTGEEGPYPCPRCVGDGFLNDGVSGGTCSAGARAGLPCDGNGAPTNPSFGPTSLDCPPSPASNVSGSGLPFNLDSSTGTETMTLSAGSPNCTAPGFTGSECFCGVCDDAHTPCKGDADCVAAGLSTCGGPGGTPTRPNLCDNPNSCTDLMTSEGIAECAGGPSIEAPYCVGGAAQGNSCADDIDCPGGICLQNQLCFLGTGTVGDQLTAVGAPSVPANESSLPTLASTTCIGPTSDNAVNDSAGMPGPLRLSLHGLARALPAP